VRVKRPSLQAELVEWFRRGHREMPWRKTADPYAIWVSEIMLQQTQVETVIPYYQRWMARFPTVRALAEAPIDDVLTRWAGLGYYARARNLHRAAGEVVARHGGRFPDDAEALLALPGIGPYTAGAIASIAFGRPAAILDGNVGRVLSRLYALEGAVDDPQRKKHLWALAAELVPADAASHFNQGMMELGATVCTPRAPDCASCPWERRCQARKLGKQEEIPPPKKKARVQAVEVATVVLARHGQVLMVRRPAAGLWGGLWEPPTGELTRDEAPATAAARVARARTGLAIGRIQPLTQFDHVLTHRRMRFHAFSAAPTGRLKLDGYEAARWLDRGAALALGVAAWTARLLKELE
jgi:A/G-specific adenine glycosylase